MTAVLRMIRLGTTVVLVEQNVKAALDIADEAIVLVGGAISERKPASQLKDSNLGDLFLGKAA
jgi:ABC-type branched-subunit amino acid transport system ATPase component